MTDKINYYYIDGIDDMGNAHCLYGSYNLQEVKKELQLLKDDGEYIKLIIQTHEEIKSLISEELTKWLEKIT